MDVAALNLEVRSDSVKQATAELKAMAPAASAAERAAQRWGLTTSAAARSSEDFSKRVQRTIRDLEFERQQLTRTTTEKERYAILRRAGVAEASAEGRAILASVTALQAQRAANEQASKASGVQIITTRAAGAAWRGMLGILAPIAAAMTAASLATKLWDTAMEVADFGEKADQMGIMVKTMQALQYAGIQNGLSVEQLENGVAKFSQKIGEAADGSKEMIEALDKIGVKILDLRGNLRPTEDLLFEVAQKIMAIDDPARRAAAAVDFFGKAGVKMLPLLKQMAEGSDAMTSAAERAGTVISDEVIGKLDKFSDRLAANGLKVRASFANLAADIIDWGNRVEEWWDKVAPNDPASVKKRQDAWRIPFEDFFDWLGDAFADIIAKAAGWGARFVAEFKEIGPSLKRVFVEAMNGVIDAIEGGLNLAQKALSNAKGWFKTQAPLEPITIGRLDPGPGGAPGVGAAAQAEAEARVRAGMPNSADIRTQSRAAAGMGSYGEDMAAGGAAGPRATSITPGGARNPVAKGGSDPYAKTIEGAKEYILTKKAEAEAVGQTVLAASRLKHEQDLLNKAQNDGKLLTDAQKAALKDLAGQMAEADNALAKAKFIDDAKTKSEDFLAQQQMERDALFMSAQAADALRYSTEMLNAAKRQGIELSPAEIEAIKATADAMAASKAKTDELKEIVGLGREVFKGFFSDMREGLMNGKSVWDSFANAAVNALNRIAEKLIEMAATQLFEAAFPGGGGGSGGGGLGGLIGGLFGGGSSGTASGIFDGLMGSSFFPTFAKGAAFRAGNVIPFAKGDVFNSPTMFPMSRGRTGLMGEAGPEAIMPLRRGPGGRLGVEASNTNSQQPVVVHVYANEGFVRAEAEGAAVRVVNSATPGIVKQSVKKAGEQVPAVMARNERDRGGEWR